MLSLFDKGGPVMVVLFVLSIYVTAVMLYKLYQFWKLKVGQKAFFQEMVKHVKDKDFEAATYAAQNNRGLLARVAEAALMCKFNPRIPKDAKENEVQLSGTQALFTLESHTRGLEMVGTLAPLLGLLGTVTGMVKAFATLENAGTQIDPSLLAGGIWEALLTTVAGLAIAIPAVAFHTIIDNKIEAFRHRMEELATRILDAV